MDSVEDDILLPIPDAPPSPILVPKLKRLKKSSSSAAAESGDGIKVTIVSVVPIQDLDSSVASESKDLEKVSAFDEGHDPVVPSSCSKDTSEEKDIDDGLDPLFSVSAVEEGLETLGLDREKEGEDDDEGFEKIGKIEDEAGKKKPVRKRLNLEEGGEEISNKRKKKSKDDKVSGKAKESVREKKRIEKERKVQLEQIHAESQRLLRETRDASFKPVPVVQKPISSVLEKIRIRKLEVLKKTSMLCQSDSDLGTDCLMNQNHNNNVQDPDLTRNENDARDSEGNAQEDNIAHVQAVHSSGSFQDPCQEIPCNDAAEMDLEDAPHALFHGDKETEKFQLNDGENNKLDDLDDSQNARLSTSDLTPVPDDLSSEDEDNDKENLDPCAPSDVMMDSSPEAAAVAKAFLDDEAEEEDDSDHDLMRFQDSEEDDGSDADEVLKDLIATGYEEVSADQEKRNQLHQKWLEQQDAAGTDDILQRLKYGQKQREPTYLLDEEDNDDNYDGFGDESEDEKSHGPPTADVRQNTKRAKDMIAQMFTDADDVYLHSDDEESEQTLMRQRILKQTGDLSFISPTEDENSREVFGMIKKLNTAPVTKKRGKVVTSSFDSLVMSGNSNSSSKSSFLNRATSTSLPSSHKQVSSTVRAFIFGRDDSNSRSAISSSENISDMDPKESHPSKPAAASKNGNNSSQFRPSASKMKIEDGSSSATSGSLFQILRHSSVQFNKQLIKKSTGSYHEITDSQAAYQFSAFKLGKRVGKVESRF